MKCPVCNHEAEQINFGNPLRCPECGVLFEKAVEARLSQAASKPEQLDHYQRQPTLLSLRNCRKCGEKIPHDCVKCPNCKTTQNRKSTRTRLVIFAATAVILYAIYQSAPSKVDGATDKNLYHSEAERSLAYTEIVSSKTRKTGFGALMEGDFVIRNFGDIAIKDIEISCRSIAPSGTVLGNHKQVIYQTLGPSSQATYKDIPLGPINTQTDATSCEITAVKLVE